VGRVPVPGAVAAVVGRRVIQQARSRIIVIMGAGEWIALAALVLTGLGMAGGIVYRMGQLVSSMRDLERRIERIEGKVDRVPKRAAPGHVG